MTIQLKMMGRLGNQMFEYAAAKWLAEQKGATLYTPPWVGQQIFQIEDPEPQPNTEYDITLSGYFQHQSEVLYTKADCQRWFKFRPAACKLLASCPTDELLCHRRVGDYKDSGYVVVSKSSYLRAIEVFGLERYQRQFITEEEPTPWKPFGLPDTLTFLPDFWRMVHCKVLLRGNSSFSWWAATIGNAEVYSPVIEGLVGGTEHDVDFVKGNWPRLANLDCVSDLHV